MSGCGSDGMAKAGNTYEEIIKYYYQGVKIEKFNLL
jgi:peptidoglycan hydrolase-like amidase